MLHHMISRWYSKQYDATTFFFEGLPFLNFYRSFIFALSQFRISMKCRWISIMASISMHLIFFFKFRIVVVKNSRFNMRSNYLSSNHLKVLVELLQYFIVFHNFLSLFQVRQLNFEDQTGNPLNFDPVLCTLASFQ